MATYFLLFVERYHNSPIIKTELKNQTVAVGDNATFFCQVMSDLHPHIKWLFGTSLNDSTFRVSIQVYGLYARPFN